MRQDTHIILTVFAIILSLFAMTTAATKKTTDKEWIKDIFYSMEDRVNQRLDKHDKRITKISAGDLYWEEPLNPDCVTSGCAVQSNGLNIRTRLYALERFFDLEWKDRQRDGTLQGYFSTMEGTTVDSISDEYSQRLQGLDDEYKSEAVEDELNRIECQLTESFHYQYIDGVLLDENGNPVSVGGELINDPVLDSSLIPYEDTPQPDEFFGYENEGEFH